MCFYMPKGNIFENFLSKKLIYSHRKSKDAQISTDFLYCIGILHIFDKSVFSLKKCETVTKARKCFSRKIRLLFETNHREIFLCFLLN